MAQMEYKMKNSTGNGNKTVMILFAIVVAVLAILSLIGMGLYENEPELLQGQIEASTYTISGKLPGRIEKFTVEEGDRVRKGDTLVLINSPEIDAQLQQVSAMEEAARYQNRKIDAGTRKQITDALFQAWEAAKAQKNLAEATWKRVDRLYRDSVATAQKRDESYALYQSASAAEKAAWNQYQLAREGAQPEDKESARALTDAAKGGVNMVLALLKDARLTAPGNGEVSDIYPSEGELVLPGAAIMKLVDLDDVHAELNIREDRLPLFKTGGTFKGTVPALDNREIEFRIYYISPLGSFATWHSTRQSGSYDMATFRIKARPEHPVPGLRPGMSVLVSSGK